MATYQKPTITISGETLMGTSFTGDVNAYNLFEAHKTIKADNDVLIPFHAVKKAVKNVTSAEAEKADPYCDEGGSDTWYIMSDPIPKGSEDYPIGRYKSNTDFTWSYEGEPTNVAVANDELVEIYRDAGVIKARQSGKFCTGWASANVKEAYRTVTAFLTPCEI